MAALFALSMLMAVQVTTVATGQAASPIEAGDESDAGAHQARVRRVLRTTTTKAWTPRHAWTTPITTSVVPAVATPPPTDAPTPVPEDFLVFYDEYANSAINMQGKSFYVNYNSTVIVLEDLLKRCFYDPSCVSFDYNHAKTEGWTHRIGKDCAAAAGADFINGDNSGTTFYQLKKDFLDKKGANRTYLGGEGCEISASSSLGGPPSNQSTWWRALGALVATLCGSAVLSWGIMYLLGWGTDRYEIWQVLNQNLDPNGVNIFDEESDSDDSDDGEGHARQDGAIARPQPGVEVVVMDRGQPQEDAGRQPRQQLPPGADARPPRWADEGRPPPAIAGNPGQGVRPAGGAAAVPAGN